MNDDRRLRTRGFVCGRTKHLVRHLLIGARPPQTVLDDDLDRIGPRVDEALHHGARRLRVGQRTAVSAAPSAVGRNRTARREDARRQQAPFPLPGAEVEDPLGRRRHVEDRRHAVIEKRLGRVREDACPLLVTDLEHHRRIEVHVDVDETGHHPGAAGIDLGGSCAAPVAVDRWPGCDRRERRCRHCASARRRFHRSGWRRARRWSCPARPAAAAKRVQPECRRRATRLRRRRGDELEVVGASLILGQHTRTHLINVRRGRSFRPARVGTASKAVPYRVERYV